MADAAPQKYAIIIHDAYSHPGDHWYRWLRASLQDQRFAVIVPDFPTPTGQTIDYWDNVLEEHLKAFGPNTIIIGHGIGAAYVLSLLSRLKTTVRDVFLVAPYYQPIGHLGFDTISESFYTFPFNWELVTAHAQTFTVYYSPKDPYVPNEQPRELATKLSANLVTIPEAEHFYSSTGYDSFPEILADIVAKDTYVAPTGEDLLAEELGAAGIDPTKINLNTEEQEEAANESVVSPTATLAPVQTYYKDLSSAITSAEAGQLASLLREDRTERAAAKSRQQLRVTNSLQITGIVVLILLGLFSLSRITLPEHTAITTNEVVPNYIPAEHQSVLATDNLDEIELALETSTLIGSTPIQIGAIHDIVLTRTILGRTERLRARSLFSIIDTNIPGLLKQDLGNFFMYGVYHSDDYEPFLIFQVDSIHRAQDNMQKWEPTLMSDLAPLLHIDPSRYLGGEEVIFTTYTENNRILRKASLSPITEVLETTITAPVSELEPEEDPSLTSTVSELEVVDTPEITLETTEITTLKEEILLDTITFTAPSGRLGPITTTTQIGEPETILIYTFVRENLLVITTSQDAVDAIVNRLPVTKSF